MRLGILLCDRRKDYDGAIAAFREVIRLQKDNPVAHHNLGTALFHKGLLADAIDEYRKAIALDPRYPNAHLNLGRALVKQGKFADAEAALRTAVEFDSKSALAHSNLGSALHRQKKWDEAIACFKKVIELDPKDADAHYGVGIALKAQGEGNEAIGYLRKAIELDPKHPHAHNALGGIFGQKGWDLANHPDPKLRDLERAVAAGKEAVELVPQSAIVWQYLGWVQYRAGNWRASIEALDRSCELGKGGDCGQWIVMSLAHAKLAAQDGLPDKARALHKAEARRRYEQADMQFRRWPGRPGDGLGRAAWDFGAEARDLMGEKEKK
jgi:superkiller protein 3